LAIKLNIFKISKSNILINPATTIKHLTDYPNLLDGNLTIYSQNIQTFDNGFYKIKILSYICKSKYIIQHLYKQIKIYI
jgi:hypothetical protein